MIKFMYNGIKVNGTLYKAWYSGGQLLNHPEGTITIYGKTYDDFPDIEGLTVQNDTDLHTDYFEKDRIRVTPDNKWYPQVLAALNIAKARQERKAAKRLQITPCVCGSTDHTSHPTEEPKAQHTPGPRCSKCKWVHEADSTAGTSFKGVELCPIHAAAPELLEDLQALIEALDVEGYTKRCGGTVLACISNAKRSIAKAEGR